MKTKNIISILLTVSVLFIFCSCYGKKDSIFSGSKTADDNHFDISFEILNTTYSHEFQVKEGDIINVHILKEAGNIILNILDDQEVSLYKGNGKVTSDFDVIIPNDGTITVSVTGEKAKGRVTFTKEEGE